MKLLHVIPYYAPAWAYGGVVRAATDLTRALAEAGHEVHVLTTDTLNPTARIATPIEIIDDVHVYRVPNWNNALRGKFNLSSPRGIAAATRAITADAGIELVHCHEVRTVENLRVTRAARGLGLPIAVSPHGTLPLDTGRPAIKKGWDRVFGRGLLRRFDRVIALTGSEAADARTIWGNCGVPLPAERIAIVPNGVHVGDYANLPDPVRFRAQWGLGDGPVVLFLGRLHERKGAQFLIPAFAEQIPTARLLMVGPDEGMLATLQAQVQEYNLQDRVIFTGLLTGADKLAALAAADVFAMPAVGEGFSMAVLEAMACGLPVLLTPGCNFPEAAEAGAGLVVERTVPAVVEGLRALLLDATRRANMGRAARELVHARYTWPQVVRQLEQVYEGMKR